MRGNPGTPGGGDFEEGGGPKLLQKITKQVNPPGKEGKIGGERTAYK